MPRANILIVESDQATARELNVHLEGFGYDVVGIAASSSEATQLIEQARPDIILMSTRLRGSSPDGIKTGSLIHKLHDLPVIYVMDQDNAATIRRAGATGPFGYIFRPLDDRQIFATIEIGIIRHQLERKLEQSRQWLNITLTSIGDGVIATDEKGVIRFINPAAMKLTGWMHEDAVGKSLYGVVALLEEASHELAPLEEIQNGAGSKESRQGFEGLLRARDGKLIPVEAKITPIKDTKGSVYGSVLVIRDITQQREATLEIRRQADRAEALVQAASQLNARQDLETVLNTICEITNRTLRAAGTAVFLQDEEKDTLRSMAISSQDQAVLTYPQQQFDFPAEVLRSILTRENPVVVMQELDPEFESPLVGIYENLKIKTVAIAALFQEEELLGALISIFTHKQYVLPEDESALLRGLADQASSAIKNAALFEQVRAGRERQRKLAKSLVDVQEAERQHIARELHDHLGQLLTGLQFMLENTKNQASGELRSNLEEIQESVTDVIGQVREMSLNLRPSMLDDLGLLPTLRWHFDRYTNQTGIRVNYRSGDLNERLPPEIEIAAYRIIQEALTNVARYAQVKVVFIGVVVQENALWVEIMDKGRGFDPALIMDRPTSGLGGMRERASLAGGYLTVRSFVDQGTQILAALPLTGQPLERRKYDRNDIAG